jgi:hypothetical protein
MILVLELFITLFINFIDKEVCRNAAQLREVLILLLFSQ